MKKTVILSMLTSLTIIICSCQKQDSAAEQQLAQRKVELDAREKALGERLNALDERVNGLDQRVRALAEKQKTTAITGTNPDNVRAQNLDPTQVQDERDRAIQQFSAQIRAMVPDSSKAKAEKDRMTQERLAHRQSGPQSQKPRKSKMFSGAVFPEPEATSAAPSSTVETTAPTPSPATEVTSPAQSPTP